MDDRILVVSDSPDYHSTRDLNTLYPGRIDEHDLNQGPITAAALAPYRKVWTLIRRIEHLPLLDYRAVREHAHRTGAQVVSHLLEYARGSGLEFRFRNAGRARHKLRIVAESDPITASRSATRSTGTATAPISTIPRSGTMPTARSCATTTRGKGGGCWLARR